MGTRNRFRRKREFVSLEDIRKISDDHPHPGADATILKAISIGTPKYEIAQLILRAANIYVALVEAYFERRNEMIRGHERVMSEPLYSETVARSIDVLTVIAEGDRLNFDLCRHERFEYHCGLRLGQAILGSGPLYKSVGQRLLEMRADLVEYYGAYDDTMMRACKILLQETSEYMVPIWRSMVPERRCQFVLGLADAFRGAI